MLSSGRWYICDGGFAASRGGESFSPRQIGQCLERALCTVAIDVEGASKGFVTWLRST